MKTTDKKISFVIPCYFSERTLAGVVEDIIKEFNDDNIEIILVNDGSTDGTFSVIENLSKKYTFVKGINLSRNFGQDGARMAGYHFVTGDYVVSLDDDAQNPPAEAHKLIAKLEEGYDVVFGRYLIKKHSKFKNFGSKVNDLMADWILEKPKDLRLCSYFVMTRFVSDEIIKYDGAYPYVWGLILRTTRNVTNQVIEHRAREVGESTYTFSKLLGLWLNGFTSFSVKPLRITAVVGMISALIGFIFAVFIIVKKLAFGINADGWASIMCIMLFLGGIMMLMMGLLGEYVGRIYINENRAPQFIIRNTVNENNENKHE